MRISENVEAWHAGPVTNSVPLPPVGEVELPGTLLSAVRAEFRRAFHSPYETPIVVVVNGLLMTVLWFGLPVGLQDALFTLHGELAFPMVLASWMISDVPATNVVGPDRFRVASVLDDPQHLRRLLYAKNLVLWALVAPFCAAVAIGIGASSHRLSTCLLTALWIVIAPMGALGVSAWVGIRFPYHPRPLRWRWENRHRWRTVIVRWLTLALVPYALVPALTVVILSPSLLVWNLGNDHGLNGRLADGEFAAGLVVSAALSAAMFFGGHRVGLAMARRRAESLRAYLADPERG